MKRHQHGLAAVTALLIVAVAAAAAALMLTQQSAMLDQTSMVMARAQADAFAQAGVDWARGVLLDDLRRAPTVDTLDEPWAQPIPALPVERAVVSGALTDEQGKFNLNMLSVGGAQQAEAIDTFRRLLGSQLGLPPDLADAVKDWVDRDQDLSPHGAEDAYYLSLPRPYRAANQRMVQVEELYRVRGFDAATVAKLRPYVTALPIPASNQSPINVNTASDVVLAAVAAVTREEAAGLVARRAKKPFADRADFVTAVAALGRPANAVPGDLDVKSSFYSVRIQVAQDDVRLATEALLQRDQGKVAVVWRRPRY